MDGLRLEKLRKAAGLSRSEIAKEMGSSRQTVFRWEKGNNEPDDQTKKKLASLLKTNVAYLMGETDNPNPLEGSPLEQAPKGDEVVFLSPEAFIPVPLLDINTMACCGDGNALMGVVMEASESILVKKARISVYDDLRPPFAIRTEGDSMEGRIKEGSEVVINPAEEVRNGDIALVCYNDRWLIRGVIFRRDGKIELKAANPDYSSIVIDDPDMIDDPSWFYIHGKVVSIINEIRPDPLF